MVIHQMQTIQVHTPQHSHIVHRHSRWLLMLTLNNYLLMLTLNCLHLMDHHCISHGFDTSVEGQSWRRCPGHWYSRSRWLHSILIKHWNLYSWDKSGCRYIQSRIEHSILALRFIVVIKSATKRREVD